MKYKEKKLNKYNIYPTDDSELWDKIKLSHSLEFQEKSEKTKQKYLRIKAKEFLKIN